MPSATGQNWEKYKKEFVDDEVEEKKITPLTDEDIQVLKTYGAAPYAAGLKRLEKQIKEKQTSVNEKIGVKESDTGLAPPHLWDIAADRQRMQEDHPLQVARCTKIIQDKEDSDKSKYVINVKQIAKFVVKLGERVSPTDIEEGMRVGYAFIPVLTFHHISKYPLTLISYPALTATNTRSSFLFPPKSTPP